MSLIVVFAYPLPSIASAVPLIRRVRWLRATVLAGSPCRPGGRRAARAKTGAGGSGADSSSAAGDRPPLAVPAGGGQEPSPTTPAARTDGGASPAPAVT